MTDDRRRRGGVPWWTPLLALLVLVAAVAGGIVATRDGDSPTRAAAPKDLAAAAPVRAANQGKVLAAKKTIVRARRAGPLMVAKTPLLPVPPTLAGLAGKHVRAREVPALAVVGPDTFWVGTTRAKRVLVHLQGGDARHRVRYGQRLSFTGVVARNRGRTAAWGVTVPEGARQLARQGAHLEVYAPRIRFDCLRRCR